MSKNDEQASVEEQGEQRNDSVFDFLYCDTQRIGSFLAQFDDAGHLQQVRQKDVAHKQTKRGVKLALGGGASLLGHGAQGNVGYERGPEMRGSEESERVYDPLWTNARTLLDYLEEREMIEDDLAKAHIGQFVLASGLLEIRDLKLVQKAIELFAKGMPETAAKPADTRHRSTAWQERQAKQETQQQSRFGMEFLGMLPHAVHARLHKDGLSVWCSLKPEALVVSADDIFLKHGSAIPGDWHILGILDAQPDPAHDTPPAEQFASVVAAIPVETSEAALINKGFAGFIDGIAPFARMLLGRPSPAYGMTPLLIFREVSG